jgi:uncharacterized protein (DUF362 family)
MTEPERREPPRSAERGEGAAVPVAAGSGAVSRRTWLGRVAAGLGMGVAGARSLEAAAPAGAVVGVARGPTMAAATRTAIRLAGGLDFVEAGQTVLVKPNICCPNPHPATTSREVLAAVLELVRERRPGRLVVGDQTFFVQSTVANVRRAGLEAAVRAHGAEFVAFDELPRRHLRPAGARHWPDGYRVPAMLGDVHHVVNLACVKTHFLARYTMAMKNAIGVIDADSRRYYHRIRGEQGYDAFAALIAEMSLALRPSLHVLDGTAAFVSGGPSDGRVVHPRLVIASRDLIATDVTGLAVLRHHGTDAAIQDHSPWAQPKIRYGVALGLGVKGVTEIDVRAEGIEEIAALRRLMA